MSNAQNTTHRTCTTLQIVKINRMDSGIALATQKPYEWHTAECFLLDDAGLVVSVGRLVFPRELRESLGGVPPEGTYRAVIALVGLTGERAGKIVPKLIDLVPIAA